MKRALLVTAALLAAAAAAVTLGADAALQTASVRTRLAAGAERAIGHATNLGDAPLHLTGIWTGRPTLVASDVTILNPPGFSRPALATVSRISSQLSLLPLLLGRVDIPSVTLGGADIRLERDATGRGNWQRPPVPPPADPETPSTPSSRRDTRIGHLTVTDSRLAWQSAPPLTATRLDVDPSGGPVSATLAVNGVPLTLSGTVTPATPAAYDLILSGAGATATLKGAATAEIHAEVPDLSTLSPLLGVPLPPLRQFVLDSRLDPAAATLSLRATAGATPFGPDLVLDHLDIAAPSPDAPAEAHATAHLRGLPVAATLTLPALATLRTQARLPLRATVQADGATVTVDATVADPSGADPQATLSARIPDLRRTGALAGLVLPALHDATLDARLAPAPSGTPNGTLAIRGLRLAAAEGDLAGDLALRATPRPTLRGYLTSQHLDLDAMLAPSPGASPAAAPASNPATPPTATPAPDLQPLPFDRLRAADIDLRATVADLRWHAIPFRAVLLRILLDNGQLRLDPAEALTPGGTVQARVTVDADSRAASVTLLAPGLDAAALSAAAGRPGAATGTLDLDLDLRAAGPTLRAMLPTLTGHAGIALVDGDLDNALFAAAAGPALRAANLPVELAGRTPLRCLALRAEATAGQVTVKTLALDSARARLEGEGAVNLVGDTVDLHLRPTVRLGGAGVAVPVRLSGPLRAPVPTLERGAVSPGRIGLSILLGGGAPPADPCPPALAAARANRPGPQPTSIPTR